MVQFLVISITTLLIALIIFLVNYVIIKENKQTAAKYDKKYFVMWASRKIMYSLLVVTCLVNIATGIAIVGMILDEPSLWFIAPILITALGLFDWFIIGAIRYSVIVDGERLIYCSFFKIKKKIFTFGDISYFVRKISINKYQSIESYIAYSKDNKRLFAVNSQLSCYNIFLNVINEREFEIKNRKNKV